MLFEQIDVSTHSGFKADERPVSFIWQGRAYRIQEIIDRSLLGKFNASEILMNLLEMGFIEIVGVRTPSFIKKVSMVKIREALTVASYGSFVVLIFLFFFYLKPNFMSLLWDSRIERVDLATPTHFIYRNQLQRVKNALEIYSLEKGSYPNRLEELVSAELLQKDDLFYRKGVSYQYELRDGKYLLKH